MSLVYTPVPHRFSNSIVYIGAPGTRRHYHSSKVGQIRIWSMSAWFQILSFWHPHPAVILLGLAIKLGGSPRNKNTVPPVQKVLRISGWWPQSATSSSGPLWVWSPVCRTRFHAPWWSLSCILLLTHPTEVPCLRSELPVSRRLTPRVSPSAFTYNFVRSVTDFFSIKTKAEH